jgi:hypothetical protein
MLPASFPLLPDGLLLLDMLLLGLMMLLLQDSLL